MNGLKGPIGVLLLAGAMSSAAAFQGAADRGRQVYLDYCVMCHGHDGSGNDGMAPDFREEWYRLSKSDAELIDNIRNGMDTPGKSYTSGPMPPQPLSERDLDDVLAYLRRTYLD